jgi:hypothetical protein
VDAGGPGIGSGGKHNSPGSDPSGSSANHGNDRYSDARDDPGGHGPGGKGKSSSNDSRKNSDKATNKYGPVVLDLSGNGISLTEQQNSKTFFDVTGDGYQHRTAWAGAGNGVLAIDADGDGKITERKEIVFTDWDPSAEDDMAALRSVFDTNNDGKLDAADAAFAKFRIVVTNADGTTSVKSLSELGIQSINLTTDATRITLLDGSSIDGMGSFTRTDGSTGKAAAVTLAADAAGYAIGTTKTVSGDGSTTLTNTARNADGSVASVTVTNTSADGLTRSINFDDNGDGVIDRVQSIVQVKNGDGSRTETITNRNSGNVLLDRIVTTTSADGNTVSIARDTRGGGSFDETETRILAVGGGLTVTGITAYQRCQAA